jgi:SNF2 family DNA or RNA helicase
MSYKPHFALFMDVGTGKTWTALAVIGRRWCVGDSDHVFIVSKNGVQSQWVHEQMPKHMPPYIPTQSLVFHTGARFEKQFAEFLAFPGLKVFAMNIEAVGTDKGRDAATRFLVAAKGTGSIYLDESHTIKDISANRTENLLFLGSRAKYRMIMTGTPIGKNVVDLYSQFRFLDKEIFGMNKQQFKDRYCVTVSGPFGDEIVGQKNVEELQEKIEPYIFRITSQEALDLPPKVYKEYPFELSTLQLSVMKEIKNEYYAELDGGTMTVTHAAAALTRLQQVSCGFLELDDGTRRQLPNPRLQALLSLLEQREGKAIIWCRFTEDIRQVWTALQGQAMHYFGGTIKEDREKAVREFLDPHSTIRYLVANPDAAGTGLNLQGSCNTNVYYSNSFDAISRWQSEGRTWRDGTVGSVAYFDLMANRSPDRRILRNLKDKKSISDLTLDDFREMIK